MTQINITPVDVEAVELSTKDAVALAERNQISFVITNQNEYDRISEDLRTIKSRFKEIENQRKEITAPMDNAKKQVMDLFRKPLDLLEKAEKIIKSAMSEYTIAQEKAAEAERKRLQELAEKAAEAERKKLQAKIEKAEATGNLAKVEELQTKKEEVTPIPVPFVAPKIETPKGVSYKDKWTGEVIDINQVPREYLVANQSAIDKILQATKGTIQIPGVKIIYEKITVSRL
jgi:archaellum component FlaC